MNDRSSTRQRRLQTSTASGSGGAKQATTSTVASSTASTSGVPRYLQRTPTASSGQALIPYKTFSKQQLKLLLRDIIGIEWMNQSGAKSPINLSQGLKSLIQTVTTLTDEDLQLLWSPPPKTPAAVLKQIDHALPATIDAPLMQKLESIKLNAVVQQKLPVTKKKAKSGHHAACPNT